MKDVHIFVLVVHDQSSRKMPLVPPPDLSIRRESTVGYGRGSSAKNQKPLEAVCNKYFIGTEDGEVVYATFKLEKDNETGKSNGMQIMKRALNILGFC